MWIWRGTGDKVGDEEEDERMASEEPLTPEQRELIAEYEAAAGTEYMQCAYHPAYRLARRLARLAIYDEHDEDDIEQTDRMLEEWQQLFRRNAVKEATVQDVEVCPEPKGFEVAIREAKETDVHDPSVENGSVGIADADDQCSPVSDNVSPEATP